MRKFVNLLFAVIALGACRAKERSTEVRYVVKEKPNLPYGWYRMLEQYPNTDGQQPTGAVNASAYLCANMETGDTILVLSTKTKEWYHRNFEAVLYPDQGVSVGDTLLLAVDAQFDKRYQRYKRAIGNVKVLLQ